MYCAYHKAAYFLIIFDVQLNTLTSYLLDSVKNHLTYPHSWVRLVTSQLFGQLFASYDPQDLANSIAVRGESIISKQKARHLNNNSSKSVKEFLLTESAQKVS